MILAEKVDLNDQKRLSLQQTSVLFFSCVAAIVLLALITYHPNDPGLFVHDTTSGVENKAGRFGAFLADILVGFLGYLSYIIPFGLIFLGFTIARKSAVDLKGVNLWLALLGGFLALLSGCGLATLLWPESTMIYKAGGLLGLAIAKIFVYILGQFGATLLLFGGFFAGITLIADIPWLKIVDYVGDKVLDGFDSIFGDGSGDKVAKIKNDSGDKKPSLIAKIGAGAVATAAVAGSSLAFLKKNKAGGDKSSDDIPVATDKIGNNEAEAKLGVPEEILKTEALDKNGVDDAIISKKDASETAVEKKPKGKNTKKALILPLVSLLNAAPDGQSDYSSDGLDEYHDISERIITSLQDYGVHGVTVESAQPGPIITRFELQLPAGTKVSKITGLAKDLARNMGVMSVRIVEVIPGKTTIGVEVPNPSRDLVVIRDILASNEFKDAKSPLTIVLGKSIGGKSVVADLTKMPHLLVAGTTGSGKSVAVNAMLMSLLYKSTPKDVRLILIDPKMLELSTYEGIPHLLTSVVTDMKDAANALRWCVGEMERRYSVMSHVKVRSIAGYNEKIGEAINHGQPIMDPSYDPTKHVDTKPKILEPLPYIVVVIDEFADMVMVVGKKVEELIARLAQKARAAGIHLVLATQRPSVDVITGLIKANIPSRIAFQVSTKVDSRTILDQGGAEQLLGLGDMLYLPPGTGLPKRVHGAFVADQEVEDVVSYIKAQGEPEYLADVLKDTGGAKGAIPGLEPLADREGDALYDEAVVIVTESRRASISYLQRRLKIGYNRAATMIEEMETAGVVSAVQSNGTREVLAPEPVAN